MLANDFAGSLDDLFASDLATDGSYEVAPGDNDETASSSSVRGIRLRASNQGGTSDELTQACFWLIKREDVSAPKRDDRYTDSDGTTWRIRGVYTARAGAWKLYAEHRQGR